MDNNGSTEGEGVQEGVKWERGVGEGSRRWHIKRKGSRVCVN